MRRRCTLAHIKTLIFNVNTIPSLFFIVGIALFTIRYFKIDVKEEALKTGRKVLISRIKKDDAIAKKNKQLEKLGIQKTGMIKTYRDLIQNVIISFKLKGVTVENFTSGFMLVGILIFMGFTLFFESIILGVGVSIPCIFAIIAFIVSTTKASVRANDNRVMDSLDLICPTIEHSVTSAIRNNIDGIDSKIKHHYREFLFDIDSRGMLFREAIIELNKKLGPRFDEFALKAVIFHEHGEEGMNEMFMDIVEMNNFTRSINAKADRIFKEINFNTVGSSLIVFAFLGYTYSNSMTADVMRNTFIGKLASALSISLIVIMYAFSQISQVTIDYSKIKEG